MKSKCNKCEVELVENSKFCHSCGYPVNSKYGFIASNRKMFYGRINELEEMLDNLKQENEKMKKELEKIKSGGPIIWQGGVDIGEGNDRTRFVYSSSDNVSFSSNVPNAVLNVV